MGEVWLSTCMVQECGGSRARSVPLEVRGGVREGAGGVNRGLVGSADGYAGLCRPFGALTLTSMSSEAYRVTLPILVSEN